MRASNSSGLEVQVDAGLAPRQVLDVSLLLLVVVEQTGLPAFRADIRCVLLPLHVKDYLTFVHFGRMGKSVLGQLTAQEIFDNFTLGHMGISVVW